MKKSKFGSTIGTALLAGSLSSGCEALSYPYGLSSFLENAFMPKQSHSLAGTWREHKAISCAGEIIDEELKFRELVFRPNGNFTFTRIPFEPFIEEFGRYSRPIKSNADASRPRVLGAHAPSDFGGFNCSANNESKALEFSLLTKHRTPRIPYYGILGCKKIH